MRTVAPVVCAALAWGGLLATAACAQGVRGGAAPVLDTDSAFAADTAVARHRDFDVEVARRREADGVVLMFLIYQEADGALRRFAAFASPDGATFSAASYEWTNDTTVVVRLRRADGSPVAGFQILGSRSRSVQRLP